MFVLANTSKKESTSMIVTRTKVNKKSYLCIMCHHCAITVSAQAMRFVRLLRLLKMFRLLACLQLVPHRGSWGHREPKGYVLMFSMICIHTPYALPLFSYIPVWSSCVSGGTSGPIHPFEYYAGTVSLRSATKSMWAVLWTHMTCVNCFVDHVVQVVVYPCGLLCRVSVELT